MNNIVWSPSGKDIPIIEPHTKTKHLLTEQYLEDYIYTLYGKGKYGVTTFTIIDGFCGGGIYKDLEAKNQSEWYGSPIRLLQAVKKGYIKSKRTYDLDVKFIFVDSQKEHLDCLKNYAFANSEFAELVDGEIHILEKYEDGKLRVQCEFLNDAFENTVGYCCSCSQERKGNSLFFLDPFGWSDVSMSSFRKIGSIKNSEIIYTFMVDFIKRFIHDPNWSARETLNKVLDAEGYFDVSEILNLEKFGEQAFYRNELMRLLRDKGNAKKMITFAMMSKIRHRVLYYLVHICDHLRALEVMKDGSWQFNNLEYQYHYEIFGYGFSPASYYQENQISLELDIGENSEEFTINKLGRDIEKMVFQNPDGFTFGSLCEHTMEKHPAKRAHYHQYLRRLQTYSEIVVYDNSGKKLNLTEKSKISNSHVIKKSNVRTLFPLRDFIK